MLLAPLSSPSWNPILTGTIKRTLFLFLVPLTTVSCFSPTTKLRSQVDDIKLVLRPETLSLRFPNKIPDPPIHFSGTGPHGGGGWEEEEEDDEEEEGQIQRTMLISPS